MKLRYLLLVVSVSGFLAGCEAKKSTEVSADSTSASPGSNAAVTEPDNSAKNERDRNTSTLTAGDQGGSPGDLDITAKIRAACVSSTNAYSMTAKNIKIITVGGKVTLRGPVKTEAEKTGLEAIAKSIAGEGSVDNQLEVKGNS